MTANGLIVAFVVAVWAAYFVPLVLRRYDEATTSSSLETLSSLSRVVRRGGHQDDRLEGEPHHDDNIEDDTVDQTEEEVGTVTETPARETVRPTRASARLAAQRRRRTLLTLLGLLALTAGLAVLSVVPTTVVLAPVALVVAWLVACRVQVRREYGLSTPRAPRADVSAPARSAAAPTRPTTVDDELTVVISGQLEDVDPGRKHVMQLEPLASDALDEQLAIAVPSVTTTGEAVWDPLPVTVPTYVTKPRVGRTVRTIDFTAAGTWTSGHVEGESVELPGHSGTAQADDTRRAAGQ